MVTWVTCEFESSLDKFHLITPALQHEYKLPFLRVQVTNKYLPSLPLLFGCCCCIEFALPCHQQFLTLTMSSTRTPLPATPWATSLLAAWQQQKELTIDSSPFESEISPSLAPSDSALQAPHCRRKPHQTQKFDVDDLTNLLLSDKENILCILLFNFVVLIYLFSIYCLGHKHCQWTAPCYPYFEKAKLQWDQDGKVVTLKVEDRQSYPNYLFKCKQCVLTPIPILCTKSFGSCRWSLWFTCQHG